MMFHRRVSWVGFFFLASSLPGVVLGDKPLDSKKLLSQPKAYVGSEVCRSCHLEHYDAWKRTLHSKMLQDVSENEDVIVVDLDQEVMKADFRKIEKKLKVPLDQVYFPKREEVKYTMEAALSGAEGWNLLYRPNTVQHRYRPLGQLPRP